jgi:predicted branched-subunit amino acid permease
MAPAIAGAWWKRAVWSQWMIDETTAVGSAHSVHELRRYGYLYTGTVLFVVWNISTLLGRTTLPAADDLVTDLGLDAAIPAVFLALLWPRLADGAQRRTALVGAVMALALVPVTPPGVPIVVAGAAIVVGWRTSAGSPVGGGKARSPERGASAGSPERRSHASAADRDAGEGGHPA